MTVTYKNFNDLLEHNKELALELLSERGDGDWQKEEIYNFCDVESFAEYELIDGWYIDLNIDRDFNGAPNPLHFIDLKELGKALVRNWDDSTYFKSNDGEILQTGYGW